MLTSLLIIPILGVLALSPMQEGFCHFHIGVDGLSLYFVLLTTFTMPICAVSPGDPENKTRIRASFLLFLYTLFGSLFMLLAFLVIIYNVGTSDLQMISLADITPLAGSIVLAGLILKLAVYGFLRILIPLLPEATAYFSPLVQTIAVITLVYSSLTTLRQTDFKCLVAYSSIAHMSVVVAGIFSNTVQGIEGGIMLSIAHGFVSPALFMLVGGVLYDRFHTRVIRYYRGEFLSLNGTFMRSPVVGLLMSTANSPYLSYTNDVTRREYMVLLTLLIPTIVFGI
ncbi:hypothetical protein P389DRAFT_184679 [Cystobasidium minutum MCA 4210]|uniref:uncharacterized protein n=1 Tax=Cystobasidium minutum MCA 4210 TaxID=1397322 RepID=UPI0034CF7F43|eukprot:jgi/Rhomi1/184679/fgenesh1_pm.20_\